jgi:hypothetical protein
MAQHRVTGSDKPKEPKPEPRGLNYRIIDQVLAAMPDGQPARIALGTPHLA